MKSILKHILEIAAIVLVVGGIYLLYDHLMNVGPLYVPAGTFYSP